jgi:uncharacterized repeat protein (TIGR03806 family)
MRLFLSFFILWFSLVAFWPTSVKEKSPKMYLSEYGFFMGNPAALVPAEGVFPYEVNAPLFSDYAEKARFIYLPHGQQMEWHPQNAFGFPEGAVLIKHFYYPRTQGDLTGERQFIETRLLLREKSGWKALTYVWNTEQTDAVLEVAGSTLPVSWKDAKGKTRAIEYTIPNVNQCKGCHSYDGAFTPIGTTARQLHSTTSSSRLLLWKEKGWLKLPDTLQLTRVPVLTDYRNMAVPFTNKQTEQAARAYLDANCAHCHNPHGPASTSGMFLEAAQTDPERLGIGKPPVAAGRGSGNRRFGIVPGNPRESILLYRMESDDPGIRMPEIGRQLAHREGIELIRAWIEKM